MNKVTDALNDYWNLKLAAPTLNEETNALRALIGACKTWIKNKDTKPDFKKNMLGQTKLNARFVGRRTEVARLTEAATGQLMILLAVNNVLTTNERGQLTFDIRKYQQKAQMVAGRNQVKGLDDAYKNERTTWVNSGKRFATSGSKLHELVGGGAIMIPKGFASHQSGALRSVHSGHGSVKDWMILGELDQKLGDYRVSYLKKAQRYKFMVAIDHGLIVDRKDRPLSTVDAIWGRAQDHLWAMDAYANMYVFDVDPAGRNLTGLDQVNHSTVNAGKGVICAGMIAVDQGVLKVITNTSGHYKPSKQDLARALEILVGEGLNLSQAEVRTVNFAAPPPTPDTVMWQKYDPVQFVNSQGTCSHLSQAPGPKP
ncbi:MAG: hypothetical protein ACT4PZ_19495 [Panacagrimonas sp.]